MLLRILLPLLLLLWLPAWGIYRIHLRHFLHGKRLLCLCFLLPNALLSAGLLSMALNESYSSSAAHIKGALLTATLCLAVPETLTAIIMSLGLLLRRRLPRISKIINCAAYLTGMLIFAGMLYGFTAGYRHIIIKDFTFKSTKVPAAFNGYRIVQLSDLHLGTLSRHKEVVQAIVDSVNACKADLIVFTGDLVNYNADEIAEFVPVLSRMQARDGVLSVMGNHDYSQYHRWGTPADSMANIQRLQEYQRDMGWKLLLNDNFIIRHNSDSLAIVGVENDGHPPFPSLGNLDKAQKGLKAGCLKILLSHDPTHWRRRVIPETDIALTLSGHTHGMQFKIGGFSPARWFYREWGGAYSTPQGQTLYVSLGTGEVMLPFRLGAWPEINVITLRNS